MDNKYKYQHPRHDIDDVIKNTIYKNVQFIVTYVSDRSYLLTLIVAEDEVLPEGWFIGKQIVVDIELVDHASVYMRKCTNAEKILYSRD
jgi:disulfide oxidoreductase YuzD